MHQQRHTTPSKNRHYKSQVGLSHIWKVIDARVNQEALESLYARVDHAFEQAGIAWNNSTPESSIDPKFVLGPFEFGFQGGKRCGYWVRIERHVDDRCYPARCCRSRG